jgi:type I restriction-modification system DNA methylase subunit
MNENITKNKGYDIVIGNPPYGAKLNSTDKSFLQTKYQTAKTIKGVQKGSSDTFTLFIELGHNLANTGGNLHYIVPISITSSDSMTGVHRLIESDCSKIKVSSYSVRPQPVFENAVVNTSILYFKKDGKPCESIFSTKMYRKNSELNLKNLIDNLEFIEVKDHKIQGRYPKISLDIERKILSKIFSNETKIGDLLKLKGQHIYYRFAGGRYYKVVTNYSTGSSAERAIIFDDNIANTIAAILSSNLYFWFYQIFSDNLNLKSYEIEVFGIPFNKFDESIKEKLEIIYAEYLKDIDGLYAPIPYHLIPVDCPEFIQAYAHADGDNGQWAIPDVGALAQIIAKCAISSFEEEALVASEIIRRRYHWDNAGYSLLKFLLTQVMPIQG